MNLNEFTADELLRIKTEVSYVSYSGCLVYLPDLFDYVYLDPDNMFGDIKVLNVMTSDNITKLVEVTYNRKKDSYDIKWIKPGFDIDHYWWMEALARPSHSRRDTVGLKDFSLRAYIDFDHIYNKEDDEKKIRFVDEDYNVPERWLI